MEIKRILFLILIVMILMSSYLFLCNKYNPLGVEIRFLSSLSHEDFRNITSKIKLENYSLNYSMKYRGQTLTMTTGKDTLFKTIPIIHGSFITNIDKKVAVIGDKVADRYFRTEDPIGRSMYIMNEKYEVIGVIKKSDQIVIPYDKKLVNLNWQKRILRFEPKHKKAFDLTIQEMDNILSVNGVEVIDTIIFRDKIYTYVNFSLLIGIYFLVVLIRKTFLIFRSESKGLWKGYKEQIRVNEWYKYIIMNKYSVLKSLGYLILNLTILFIIFEILKQMKIPQIIIPDNLASLKSYIDVAMNLYGLCLSRMEYGFGEILIEKARINLLIVVFVICMCLYRRRKRVRDENRDLS